MTVETILILAVSIILLYIKPGPNQAMKITRALNDGFFPAWYFTLGATSTVILYFIIAGLGIGLIQNFLQAAGIYFKIFGGFYLIYMGYKGLSNIEKGTWKKRVEITNRKEFVENYMIGVVMTLANPITIFYFISIVPTFLTVGTLGMNDILIGVAVIIIVTNFTDVLLIAMVTQAREALSDTKFVRNINIVTSIGFILIGAFLLFSAMTNYSGAFNIL